MNTFFVRDILRINYFFSEKNRFYLSSEKRISWPIALGFLFCFSFLSIKSFLPLFFKELDLIFIFYFLLIVLVFGVFFLYKDKDLFFKFLPFAFFAFEGLVSFVIFSNLQNVTFLLNFDFLFSSQLLEQIKQFKPPSKSAIFQGASIVLYFFLYLLRIFFLLFFCFLNLEKIKKALCRLKQKPLTLITFFIFLIIFKQVSAFGSNDGFIFSSNQNAIDETFKNSSTFNYVFFLTSIIILVPIWEELIFRYAVFAIFGKKEVFWGVFFSVFFFTTVHYQPNDFAAGNFIERVFSQDLIVYLYGSVILSYLFWFYNLNLFFPIFFHFFWNFISSVNKIGF